MSLCQTRGNDFYGIPNSKERLGMGKPEVPSTHWATVARFSVVLERRTHVLFYISLMWPNTPTKCFMTINKCLSFENRLCQVFIIFVVNFNNINSCFAPFFITVVVCTCQMTKNYSLKSDCYPISRLFKITPPIGAPFSISDKTI